MQPVGQLDNAVSGDRAEQLANDLQHQKSRLAIKSVVEDYAGSTEFAKKIKEIQLETLESTETYKKISDKVQGQINQTLADNGLKNRNFWIPVWINVVLVVVSVGSMVVAILKSN